MEGSIESVKKKNLENIISTSNQIINFFLLSAVPTRDIFKAVVIAPLKQAKSISFFETLAYMQRIIFLFAWGAI